MAIYGFNWRAVKGRFGVSGLNEYFLRVTLLHDETYFSEFVGLIFGRELWALGMHMLGLESLNVPSDHWSKHSIGFNLI